LSKNLKKGVAKDLKIPIIRGTQRRMVVK